MQLCTLSNSHQPGVQAALAGFSLPESSEAAIPSFALEEPVPTAARPLYLNYNENSLGMSPKASAAAAAALASACRYPDAARAQAAADIAAFWRVGVENVAIGNGSSEIIRAVIASQVNKARLAGQAVQLLEPMPTFDSAAVYARALGIPVTDVPVDGRTCRADAAALRRAAEAFDGLTILYFCNPNNPTGCASPASEINAWVEEAAAKRAPIFFLIDEAYAEFVTDPSVRTVIECVRRGCGNVVVSRTFSKLYAMAGLRFGYGIGVRSAAAETNAFCAIDNANAAAAAAASASLKDAAYAAASLEAIQLSRKIVEDAFRELAVEWVPTQANFIFHRVKGSGREYARAMAERHVIVGRAFPPLGGWSRLTLGTPGEMKACVRALRAVHEAGWL